MGTQPAGAMLVAGSPLLERSGEIARADAALDQACGGTGSFLVVEAPAGMGKTALLRASRALAEARGMRILRGRGAQLEQEFAFGIVRQLFEPTLAGATPEERSRATGRRPGDRRSGSRPARRAASRSR